MELKIEIDETKFKDVIENELKAFSKEELHEIIHKAMEEYLRKPELLDGLFTKQEFSNYYGSSRTVPSDLLQNAAKTIDLSPAFEEIKELMINALKTNYRDILISLLQDVLKNGLTNLLFNAADFKDKIRDIAFDAAIVTKNN